MKLVCACIEITKNHRNLRKNFGKKITSFIVSTISHN